MGEIKDLYKYFLSKSVKVRYFVEFTPYNLFENLKTNLVKQFYVEELDKIISSENSLLIDVRTKEEYAADHINGSVNIPLDELRDNLFKINKDKTIYLICFSALRSYIAARILTQKGNDCFHLA